MPGSPMDCPIHASAPQQRRIRSIYNRVHTLFCDVTLDYDDPLGNHKLDSGAWPRL
jgi:hypothetical protein